MQTEFNHLNEKLEMAEKLAETKQNLYEKKLETCNHHITIRYYVWCKAIFNNHSKINVYMVNDNDIMFENDKTLGNCINKQTLNYILGEFEIDPLKKDHIYNLAAIQMNSYIK